MTYLMSEPPPNVSIYRAADTAFVINWKSRASGTVNKGMDIKNYENFLETQPRDIITQNTKTICGIDFVTEQIAIHVNIKYRYKWRGALFWRENSAGRVYFKSHNGISGYFSYRPGFGVTQFSMSDVVFRYESGRPLLRGCKLGR